MERRTVIKNKGHEFVKLESAMSACYHLPRTGRSYRLSHLSGRWGAEYMIRRQFLTQGKILLENRTGISTTFAHPFFALDEGDSTEHSGCVWFGTLLWNGNWKFVIEQDPYEQICVTGGINDFDFSFPLKPGDSFETPAVLSGLSTAGFGGASRMLHSHQRRYIAPQGEASRSMPVLFSTWANMEWDVNEAKIFKVIDLAKKVGCELFVIDSGWQQKLGDWRPDKLRFPGGMKAVSDKVKNLGMDFGLWVEAESFETKSELYRKHPDWAMCYNGRKLCSNIRADAERRQVFLLNFARDEVAEYILGELRTLIRDYSLDFLKLDMNSYFNTPGWEDVPDEEQKTIWVKYAKNLLQVFAKLKTEFPSLLLENCAAGSGRSDLLMDSVFGRINRSDNQDTLDIIKMHEGFTWMHPSKLAGGACHISDAARNINLRSTPMKMQAYAGMMGSLSVGKKLGECPAEELAEIRAYLELYKRIRHIIRDGELFRISSFYDTPYAAFEFVSHDKTEALLFVFGHSMQFAFKVPPFKLKGLDAAKFYNIENHGENPQKNGFTATPEQCTRRSGQGLMELGIRVELLGDYDAQMIYFHTENTI
ncbi:MAG: hypothetical protein A2096_06015 [Spirochaetes bacterium GWF1_41_5]|nr:MAG: hypothetical protein A2096_06015 [Spirochaetes bacterium GWF1_41_5]HBE02455.1 hypothetical protein [Spirochaetia bacterium]